MINSWWVKDQAKVFFKNKLIKDANLDSFELLENWYSKDKLHVYYYKKLVEGLIQVISINSRLER